MFTVDSTLDALGNPEALANEYLTIALLSRADIEPLTGACSAGLIPLGRFEHHRSSCDGRLNRRICPGGVLMLSALLKLIHPHTAGLWAFDRTGDLQLSSEWDLASRPSAPEMFLVGGILPVGLLTGCGLVALTTRFALWCARRYRQSRVFP